MCYTSTFFRLIQELTFYYKNSFSCPAHQHFLLFIMSEKIKNKNVQSGHINIIHSHRNSPDEGVDLVKNLADLEVGIGRWQLQFKNESVNLVDAQCD